MNYADVEMKHSRFKDGGETTMPYVGLYGTWVTDNGFYIDAIGRYIRNDTEAHFHDSLGVKRDFDVKGNIGAFSVETGKQFYVTDRFILQPRAELSYIYMQVDSFKDALGYQAKYEDTQSLLGTAGLIARYDMGKFSPYAKASFLYEFDGKTDIVYDNFGYNSDIGGARAEGALGLVWNMTDNWHFFAEAGYQGGAKHYKNYNGNLGLRYSFGKSQEKAAAPAPVSVVAAPAPVLPETAPKREPKKYDSIAVFKFNSSTVDPQARQKIQQAAEEIKQTEYRKVTITGHSDSIGTHATNKAASLKRANAVAAEFEKAGIEKTALEAYGEAYDSPIADNSSAAGRAKNRRVDVKVE